MHKKKPERYTSISQASFANTAGRRLYAGLFGPAANSRTRKPLIIYFIPIMDNNGIMFFLPLSMIS